MPGLQTVRTSTGLLVYAGVLLMACATPSTRETERAAASRNEAPTDAPANPSNDSLEHIDGVIRSDAAELFFSASHMIGEVEGLPVLLVTERAGDDWFVSGVVGTGRGRLWISPQLIEGRLGECLVSAGRGRDGYEGAWACGVGPSVGLVLPIRGECIRDSEELAEALVALLRLHPRGEGP